MKEIEFKSPVGLYRFTPEPGEVFVLKVDATLSEETSHRIKKLWDAVCPGVKVIVLDNRVHLGVIKP